MERKDLPKKRIPNTPGIYYFLGKRKEILYIGKATSLNQRIRSYFDLKIKEKRSSLIERMVREAKIITWQQTDSVLEALLLEANCIRTHKPSFNTRSKDDKSYNHVVITNDEFPRILVIRGKDLVEDNDGYAHVFGPFPNGVLFNNALKIIRKLFQFYDTAIPVGAEKSKMAKGKIDFNRQIGLYPGNSSKEEYKETVRHIRLFFEGKKKTIIADLKKKMHEHAQREEFEMADAVKKKIFALQHIQDVSLLRDESRVYKDDRMMRIESYDIAHMSGKDMVGVMTVVQGEEVDKSSYRKFIIRGYTDANDPGALSEVLERRLKHTEWKFPDLIVVDGSTAQKNAALNVLKKVNIHIPVVGVVKDEKHRPKRIIGPAKLISEHKMGILLSNAEAHRFAITFHRVKRGKAFLGA